MRLSASTRCWLAAVLATGLAASLAAAQAQPAPASGPPPQQHPTSTPYAGDPSIFETPGRAERLHIDRVMKVLGLGPGKTVADIGAGGGWFTVRAAKAVAPGGTVIAEDINPQFLGVIRKRAADEHLDDVRTVQGTPDDPRLPPDSVDAVLMLKMYHEIAHPQPVLHVIRDAMRPGAKLGIIDRNGHGDDHGLTERTLREEVERAGFRQVARYDFTKDDGEDYFLVFERR